jgi:hypothetical protein
LCGVCFEAAPLVMLQPCKHQLCVGCCSHLLHMNSRCVLVCPFCRWVLGSVAACILQSCRSCSMLVACATEVFAAPATCIVLYEQVALWHPSSTKSEAFCMQEACK